MRRTCSRRTRSRITRSRRFKGGSRKWIDRGARIGKIAVASGITLAGLYGINKAIQKNKSKKPYVDEIEMVDLTRHRKHTSNGSTGSVPFNDDFDVDNTDDIYNNFIGVPTVRNITSPVIHNRIQNCHYTLY
jgi:hypothetical protein